MEGGDERVGKFSAVALECALECGNGRVFLSEVDNEFGKGLVADSDVIFELRADLRCGAVSKKNKRMF